jgi:Ca2+:H+ antiporter
MVLTKNDESDEIVERTILNLSRGTALLLLLLYVLFLWFQLHTHHNLFHAASVEAAQVTESEEAEPIRDGDDQTAEETHISVWAAAGVLVVTTILVSVCADYLVDSIDALVERAHISRNFIGLILIPIVGNAAEHVSAMVAAIKNRMDLVWRTAYLREATLTIDRL